MQRFHSRNRMRCARIAVVLALATLAAGCGKTLGGYPNHASEPSLVAPSASARDDRAVYMDLIRQMQQQGAYYASLAHIDAYRQRFGTTTELRRRQADALRETGQWDASRAIYQSLTGGDQAAPAWHGLGLVAAHEGQDEQAEQALLKATQLEPVNAAYLSDLGYARLCAGRFAQAREPLAMAAELAPSNAKVLANLALWAMLTGNDAQAEAIMQRAALPAAGRDDVRRLAVQMAVRRTQAPAAGPNGSPGATAPAAGVPDGMLQRFSASNATHEARP